MFAPVPACGGISQRDESTRLFGAITAYDMNADERRTPARCLCTSTMTFGKSIGFRSERNRNFGIPVSSNQRTEWRVRRDAVLPFRRSCDLFEKLRWRT